MRRTALVGLIALLAVVPGADAQEPTGRLLVSLKDGARPIATAAARPAGPRVPQIGLLTVRPAKGTSARALTRRLRADPRVRAVEAERRATPRFVPDDPALSDPETAPGTPPGTVVQWWVQRTGLFEAWDLSRGTNAVVAVIDSGVDGAHPEVGPKVRDTFDADPTPGAGGPLTDEAGHGTHVSSLACAQSGDGIGMAGAGLECGILAIKTDFSDGSVAQSIVEAADRGADVINLSFGTDGGRIPPTAIVDALRYAAGRGSVLIAAASDLETEEQGDPANVLQPTGTGADLTSNLGLTVTAATFGDQRAAFAGRGSQISLAGYGAFERGSGPRGLFGGWPAGETTFDRGEPGPAAIPPCRCRTTYRGDARYAYLQGTSMATAIVSGVAALVVELNPDLAPADVVRLLKQTARRPAGSGWNPELGWGIVDARTALETARRIDRRAPVSKLRGPRRARRGLIRLRWSATDESPPGVTASGVARYEVWRSIDGGRARRIRTTQATTMRTAVRSPGRVAFYTVAVDRAGNREQPPARADATVRVRRG
jgi:subtilisin family serine protease